MVKFQCFDELALLHPVAANRVLHPIWGRAPAPRAAYLSLTLQRLLKFEVGLVERIARQGWHGRDKEAASRVAKARSLDIDAED